MGEKSQRSFFVKLSILIMGVVSLLVFAYAIIGDNGYLELKRREKENLQLNRKIERLRDENKAILQQIKALKTDPKVIEKIAREELGMVKPGEVKITTNPVNERKAPRAEPGQPNP
jgi:cell division protein FtsB